MNYIQEVKDILNTMEGWDYIQKEIRNYSAGYVDPNSSNGHFRNEGGVLLLDKPVETFYDAALMFYIDPSADKIARFIYTICFVYLVLNAFAYTVPELAITDIDKQTKAFHQYAKMRKVEVPTDDDSFDFSILYHEYEQHWPMYLDFTLDPASNLSIFKNSYLVEHLDEIVKLDIRLRIGDRGFDDFTDNEIRQIPLSDLTKSKLEQYIARYAKYSFNYWYN